MTFATSNAVDTTASFSMGGVYKLWLEASDGALTGGDYVYITVNASEGDLDADGLSDDWEEQHFGGPTNATATADDDEDGMSNWGEYVADTIPTNALSCFRISAMSEETEPFAAAFQSSTGRQYRLYGRASQLAGDWTLLDGPVWGTGALLDLQDTNAWDRSFYRVGVTFP